MTPGPRAAAYEVLRRTFERRRLDRPRVRRRRRAARARRPRARPGAAPRLRRGAAARDHRPPDRGARRAAGGKLDPSALAALRLGLYELLFSDGRADHAAVDQAVELAKRGPARRAPRGRAAAGAGFVNACCAAPPASASSCSPRSTTRPRTARRSPTRTPSGWPRCGGRSSGPTEARLLMAAMNEPPETRLAGQHAARRAARRWRPSCARPGSRSPGPASGALLDPADGDRRRRAPATRSARGSRPASSIAAVARLAGGGRAARPAAGRAGARPLRRARDQDDRDRGADRGPRRGRLGRARRAPGRASSRELCAARRAPAACGSRSPTRPRPTSAGLRSRPRGPAVLRPRDARLAPRRALAQVARGDVRAARRAPAPDPGRGARALRPGGTLVYSTCTISRAENEDVVAGACRGRRPSSVDDLGARPSAARRSRRDARFLQLAARPRRHRRLLHRPLARRRGADGMSASRAATPRCARPALPGCGEPWLRPTQLPGRYRCVYCLRRYELVSGCPDCGEHQTIVRMSDRRGPALPALRPLDAEAGLSAGSTGPTGRSTAAAGSRPRSSPPTSPASARRSRR